MPLDSAGRWVPKTSPKQDDLRELCRRSSYVLASGPRYSGKTAGCEHAIVEHGWNTPFGNDCLITCSQTVGVDSGIWKELTQFVIPQWIRGDFGMRWVREPFTVGVSKRPMCEITNRVSLDLPEDASDDELRAAGAVTAFQLESLKVEAEAEDRFKPRKFTGIYVPELTTFHDRKTFDTWTECLRPGVMESLPAGIHFLFLADTNPPDDESWWIHDLWWDLLEAEEASIDPVDYGFPEDDQDALPALLELKRGLARIDINVEDNPFADPSHVRKLKAKYAHNHDLYQRYILGQCVQTTENSLFHTTFRPSFHVIGEIESPANKEPEIMVPEEGCYELCTGWDPGDSVNSAAVIAEKGFTTEIIQVEGKEPIEMKVPVFKFLDEVVWTGEPHKIEDFVLEFMKKMAFWENVIERPGRTVWRHWSDDNVFGKLSPETKRYLNQLIYDASVMWIAKKEVFVSGPVVLQAVEKGPGSVAMRIDLWKKLLFDERLFFSASRCPKLIAMNKGIKKGKTAGQLIMKGTPHKHPFDAGSYLVASEASDELYRRVMSHLINTSREKNKSSMVSIPV